MMLLYQDEPGHYYPGPTFAEALDIDDETRPSTVHTRVWGDGEVTVTYRNDDGNYGCQLKCNPEFHVELKRWYAAEFAAGTDHAYGKNLIPGILATMASGWNKDFVWATFEALTAVICEYEDWNFERLLGLAA